MPDENPKSEPRQAEEMTAEQMSKKHDEAMNSFDAARKGFLNRQIKNIKITGDKKGNLEPKKSNPEKSHDEAVDSLGKAREITKIFLDFQKPSPPSFLFC